MSEIVTVFPLNDGPLARYRPRAEVVTAMAGDLVRLDAFASEADAIRCLMARRVYTSYEIMSYIDDARQVAMQEVVAEQMSVP